MFNKLSLNLFTLPVLREVEEKREHSRIKRKEKISKHEAEWLLTRRLKNRQIGFKIHIAFSI